MDIVQYIVQNYPELPTQFLGGAKDVLIGIVILLIGLVMAWFFGAVTRWALNQLGVDSKIKKLKLEKGLIGFTVAGLAKIFVEVLVFLAFATSAAVYFHLPGLVTLCETAFFVTAEILKAAVIILITMLIAEFVSNMIKGSKITLANTWGIVVEVLVAVIGVTIAMNSVSFVNASILNSIITVFALGVALAFGLAIGLAFGLGGKDTVAEVLKKKKKMVDELI